MIHDYGDLCQAITELAVEQGAPMTTSEFGVLNACLDDAIAAAVTEHARQRELVMHADSLHATDMELAFLVHELRNLLNAALLSFEAIRRGNVALDGATSALHARSLRGLVSLVDRALAEARLAVGPRPEDVRVAELIRQVEAAAALEADSLKVRLTVGEIDPDIWIRADREILAGVLANLLQNALKFTRENGRTDVSLRVAPTPDRVLLEVEDQCGGLTEDPRPPTPPPSADRRSLGRGLGIGLAICRRGVDANGGELLVRNLPGQGCVFAVSMPRIASPPPA